MDNATGASGITAVSADLNGTLTATGGLPTMVTVFWGLTDGDVIATNWANSNVSRVVVPGGIIMSHCATDYRILVFAILIFATFQFSYLKGLFDSTFDGLSEWFSRNNGIKSGQENKGSRNSVF